MEKEQFIRSVKAMIMSDFESNLDNALNTVLKSGCLDISDESDSQYMMRKAFIHSCFYGFPSRIP